MSRKNGRIMVLMLVMLMLVIIGISVVRDRQEAVTEEPDTAQTDESVLETDMEQESGLEVDAGEELETSEIVYQEPGYAFTTEEVTIPIEGVTREYTIAWVSDLHLVSDHEAGDALGDVHAEYLDAIERRYQELAVTEDGVHAEELWPEIIKYLNYTNYDGVIFGGDIMDYCSNSNVSVIKEGLDKLQIPYIYVRADHDYGTYYGGVFFTETEARELHRTIDGDEIANKFWNRNEFMVLGIDNSTKDMPEYYLNMVIDVYSRGIPVIMATHVPYESLVDTSLAECSMQVRGKIYYWSNAGEQFNPNDITRQYLDMVYSEDTVVAQVLAGHLHASWNGMLTPRVPQHIFEPAFRGNIGVIHIVPAES